MGQFLNMANQLIICKKEPNIIIQKTLSSNQRGKDYAY